MITRANIIQEARTWIGTPFKHQGRVKGIGVDCVGLIIGIAKAFNLSDFDITHYSRLPDGFLMQSLLDLHLQPINKASIQAGDILLMRFEHEPQHLAIVSDIGIIHAYAQVRRCVEHRLDDLWRSRIVSAYAFPSLIKATTERSSEITTQSQVI